MRPTLYAPRSRNPLFRPARQLISLALLLALLPLPGQGYSVLTHEAIVDASWDSEIKPLLLARFPASTPDDLRQAHSYAYGGCIIQDLGYYPFGSHLFTNLLHYVRSGDFIENLLRDAQDENEYAFALGSMAHYFADTSGHSVAINPGLALRYPKLHRKYGDIVTYDEAPKQHILVEFSFDVVQVAGGAYAPQAYHDFIGFQVATPLLERAFKETYGLDMKSIFFSEDLALATYRRAVSKTIPDMTRVAWKQKHADIEKLAPGIRRKQFIYSLPRRKFEREFGNNYEKPGFAAEFLVFLFRLVPKIGPFQAFAFRAPTPKMEQLFQNSFQDTHQRYDAALRTVEARRVQLPDVDFDTAKPTQRGEYALADLTYAQLLDQLAKQNFSGTPPELSADILSFYANATDDPVGSKKDRKRGEKTKEELDRLKSYTAMN